MKKFYCKMISVIVVVLFLFTLPIYGQEDKKVVLITMNEINFEELYSINSIQQLISQGSIAVMNNRTSTKANIYKAYATIGTGIRAEASMKSMEFVHLTEENASIYQRRTGVEPPEEGIINLGMAKLAKLNSQSEYGSIPGALGQALHKANMKTATIGNEDTDKHLVRLAPVIAMDYQGYVDYGSIGEELLIEDSRYPYGLKTDYQKSFDVFTDSYEKSSLIVVDIGDIGRLERYKHNVSDDMYVNMKKQIFKDVDDFMSQLKSVVDFNNTRLFIVTPYPSTTSMAEGDKLTPVIAYGDGISSGMLFSGTTRREGVIGNVDIAPSIIDYLGISSEDMTGRPVRFIEKKDNFLSLMKLNQRIVATSNHRYPVLSTFGIFEIVISLLTLAAVLVQDKLNIILVNWFKNILLSTMIVPFSLLILPLFVKTDLFFTFVVIIAITVVITFITKKISQKPLDCILILSSITTIGLLIDTVTKGNLIKHSLLGYDPIIGARYYGIGNEYMGVLMGASLVFATSLIDRFKIHKAWAVLIFVITTIVLGFPGLGANVGGLITAVAAFLFTSLRLFNVKIGIKQLMLIGVIAAIAISGMAIIDMFVIGNKSHLAGAVMQIVNTGPKVIFLIIERKIAMNMKLIGITIWSRVLISAIIILGTLFYRPIGTIYKLTFLFPNLSKGWSGIVMACIVGFLVNDSGVVAAATGIIFLAMSMLYLTIYLPKENSRV